MTNISTLKDLTQTTYDSVEGYRKAAEKAEKPSFKRAFERRRDLRAQTLEQLNNALQANDEQPITSTSVSASAHQTWQSISDAFSTGDDAVISRVEEGEDYIAGQFKDALEDDQMEASLRMTLEKAYREISEGERFTDMLEEQYA